MTFTRRRFVQLIGAAVAAVQLPKPIIASGLPRLVGDGVHNDAPALMALLNRQPIEIGPLVTVGNAGWVGNRVTLPMGRFRLETPLVLEDVTDLTVSGQTVDGAHATRFINNGGPFFRIYSAERLTLSSLAVASTNADQPVEMPTYGTVWKETP